MALMEDLASKLPNGIGHDWTGMSYQERLSGNQAPALYAISLIVVFLCLAALYESWSIPFSVMLVVPLGVVGALLAASLRRLNNDVYFRGRAINHDWTFREKRHSDRGICQGSDGKGRSWPDRGNA